MMKMPEIPNTWLIALLIAGCLILRAFGIDSLITGALMALVGYCTAKHVENTRNPQTILPLKLK